MGQGLTGNDVVVGGASKVGVVKLNEGKSGRGLEKVGVV